jgi:hypothetical protein
MYYQNKVTKNKNSITKLLIIQHLKTKWRLLSWFNDVDGVKEKEWEVRDLLREKSK